MLQTKKEPKLNDRGKKNSKLLNSIRRKAEQMNRKEEMKNDAWGECYPWNDSDNGEWSNF